MSKYLDYNIIPIGDHCAISIILKELNIRKKSYPFDWVTKIDQVYDTNIIYNLNLIDKLILDDDINKIINIYIGDAFTNNKINILNNIWFPHDDENNIEKYKRRFLRLKEDIYCKNIYILLTRHYYISQEIFEKIINQLLNYNNNSIILFISGINHEYFENMKYKNVIFKYIYYDISKFYDYDYTVFRPSIKSFMIEFFNN